MKNKILININNSKDISFYKENNINNFLFFVNHLSIGENIFDIDELSHLNENIFLNFNKILNKKDVEYLKSIKKDLSFTKGILFEDLAVYNILKDENVKLFYNQNHFVINSRVINFFEKRNVQSVLSNELTKEEIQEILDQIKGKIIFNIYGKNTSMYSRRNLISSYNNFENINNVKKGIIKSNQNEFSINEYEEGTIIKNNVPFNYIDSLDSLDDKKILYYNIELEKKEDLNKVLNNDIKLDNRFLLNETVYKLEDKND